MLPHPASVNQWFAARPHLNTHDTKLKVFYLGAVLLRHAVDGGDVEAVRFFIDLSSFVRLIIDLSFMFRMILSKWS